MPAPTLTGVFEALEQGHPYLGGVGAVAALEESYRNSFGRQGLEYNGYAPIGVPVRHLMEDLSRKVVSPGLSMPALATLAGKVVTGAPPQPVQHSLLRACWAMLQDAANAVPGLPEGTPAGVLSLGISPWEMIDPVRDDYPDPETEPSPVWVRMVPPSYEVRASTAPPVWWDFVVVAPTTDPQLPLAGWWVRAQVSLLVHKAAMRSDGTWPLRPLGSYHYGQWSHQSSVLISGRGHHLDPKSDLKWTSSRLGFAYPAEVSGEKPEAVFLRALRLLADTRREARDRR